MSDILRLIYYNKISLIQVKKVEKNTVNFYFDISAVGLSDF